MRSIVLVLAFLHAVAGTAQITVSDEVVSDPLQIHATPLLLATPAVTLSEDRAGVAVAWSMANGAEFVERIYVARLDAAGHVAGAIREIPLSVPGVQAHEIYPSLAAAPGGDGFLLTWLENDGRSPVTRIVLCRLDASLTPSAPTSLLLTGPAAAPPIIRTKGDIAWISAGGYVWSLARDGTIVGPLSGQPSSDMTIATNLPKLVGGRNVRSVGYTCQPGCLIGHTPGITFCPDPCRIYSATYSLNFIALLTTAQTKTFSFNSDAQPAIDSNGGDVLLAWFRGTQASGGDVVALRLALGDLVRFADAADHPEVLAQFPPDAGETRPAIATDGQRYVVVWRARTAPANHDIVGMAIDNDGKLTPLSIATSSVDERDPAILYVGGGTYLVAYEKTTGTERRIAGRFVTFGRHRATR